MRRHIAALPPESTPGDSSVVVTERACTCTAASGTIRVARAASVFAVPALEVAVPDVNAIGVVIGSDGASARLVPARGGPALSPDYVVLLPRGHCFPSNVIKRAGPYTSYQAALVQRRACSAGIGSYRRLPPGRGRHRQTLTSEQELESRCAIPHAEHESSRLVDILEERRAEPGGFAGTLGRCCLREGGIERTGCPTRPQTSPAR